MARTSAAYRFIAAARWRVQRHPPDAIRFERGGHPDGVHQIESVGTTVSLRGADGTHWTLRVTTAFA